MDILPIELVDEKLIEPREAVGRVSPDQLDQLLHPMLDPEAEFELLGRGLPASPGGATGQVVFSADEAVEVAKDGTPVILVRRETTPEDIRGMAAAEGILTAFGGASSHAALVSRQMGKVCVVGCSELKIDYAAGTLSVGDLSIPIHELRKAQATQRSRHEIGQ